MEELEIIQIYPVLKCLILQSFLLLTGYANEQHNLRSFIPCVTVGFSPLIELLCFLSAQTRNEFG